jgi:hypothetical protein
VLPWSASYSHALGDGETPICQRCIRGGRICSYQPASKSTISFRYSYLSSLTSSQRPSSSSSSSGHGTGPGIVTDAETANGTVTGNRAAIQSADAASPTTSEPSSQFHALNSSTQLSDATGFSPGITSPHTSRSHDSTASVIAAALDGSESSPGRPLFPLSDALALTPKLWDRDPAHPLSTLEAEMMQFYVDEIGPWVSRSKPAHSLMEVAKYS